MRPRVLSLVLEAALRDKITDLAMAMLNRRQTP
jgi:hypothetical protein